MESQITVIVTVDDVNDNTPVFKGTNQAQIPENVSPNTQVLTVQATDADAGLLTCLHVFDPLTCI